MDSLNEDPSGKISPDQPPLKRAREVLDNVASAFSSKREWRLTMERLDQQDVWNNVFSTKLIEVLDKIDEVRAGVRASLGDAKAMRDEASAKLDEADSTIRSCLDELRATKLNVDEASKSVQESVAEAVVSISAFRSLTGWLIGLLALSFLSIAWTAWISLRSIVALSPSAPIIASICIFVTAAMLFRLTSRGR